MLSVLHKKQQPMHISTKTTPVGIVKSPQVTLKMRNRIISFVQSNRCITIKDILYYYRVKIG